MTALFLQSPPRTLEFVVGNVAATGHDNDGRTQVPSGNRRGLLALLGLTIPAVLFLLTVRFLDVTAMVDFGLIDVFPIVFYIGLFITVVAFIIEITRSQPKRKHLLGHIVLLLAYLYCVTPATYEIPRYAWTYKHIGVTDQILQLGGLERNVDVYNNWSGFFGLAALFSRLSGLDPAASAAWAEPFFAALGALVVGHFARTFFRDIRVAFGAAWMFLATSWVGQMYYAPQPLAFIGHVLVVSLAARHLCTGRSLIGAANGPRVSGDGGIADIGDLMAGPRPASRVLWKFRVLLIILLVFIAIATTHQLTPFLTIASVVVLVVFSGLRPMLLPVLMVTTMQSWFYIARDFLALFPSLTGNRGVSGNTESVLDLASQTRQSAWVALAAKGLSVSVWMLGGLGALAALRRRRIDFALPTLLLVPFPLLGVSDYGGEAIYRVFLFSLPPAVTLAAYLLFGRGRGERRVTALLGGLRRTIVPLAVSLACVAGFVVAYFGREQTNRSVPAELDLYRYVAATAPKGSLVVYLARTTPSRFTANYGDFSNGPFDLALLDIPAVPFRQFTSADATQLAAAVLSFPGRRVYLVLSDSQQRTIETYGLVRPQSYEQVVAAFEQSPVFEIVYRNETGEVLQVHLDRLPGEPNQPRASHGQ